MIQTIVTTMTAEDFRQMISEVVDERLKNHSATEDEKRNPENSWLTSKEVCTKLSICLATLDNWVNKGKIIRHKIGRRTYYDENEIKKLMKG